jgi:hypothetical protein
MWPFRTGNLLAVFTIKCAERATVLKKQKYGRAVDFDKKKAASITKRLHPIYFTNSLKLS